MATFIYILHQAAQVFLLFCPMTTTTWIFNLELCIIQYFPSASAGLSWKFLHAKTADKDVKFTPAASACEPRHSKHISITDALSFQLKALQSC